VLDLSLRGVSFRYPASGFSLTDIDLTFPRSTHTAIAGPAGAGASTLLRLIAGELRPDRGEIQIGARVVNDVKRARRPLLYVTSELAEPDRWSVQHALIAAVRQRTLDRVDRQGEYDLALKNWKLESLASRRIASLSSSERTLVHLARIELLRPGILIADRILEPLNSSALPSIADQFFRMLRIIATTVIAAPSSRLELGLTDSVAILREGRVVQHGSAAHVYSRPTDDASAAATGDVNVIPVTVRKRTVESVIGAWEVSSPPFEGRGVALARPEEFHVVGPNEDSDLIFGVEEACFVDGRWIASGFLSGGFLLRVALPAATEIHKGKLLPLRYDGTRFVLIRREVELPAQSAPTDVVPPLRETR